MKKINLIIASFLFFSLTMYGQNDPTSDQWEQDGNNIKANITGEVIVDSDNHEKLRLKGPTSDYIISLQDGTGRVQHYWNSTAGSSPTYIKSGEPAGRILFSPSNTLFSISRGDGGNVGDIIDYKTYLALSNSGVFTIYDPGSSTGYVAITSPDGNPGIIFRSNDPENYRGDVQYTNDGFRWSTGASTGNPETDMALLNNGNLRVKRVEPISGALYLDARNWGMVFDINDDGNDINNFIWRGANNEVMRLSSDGRLGIGTNNPSEKLEVNGTIRAKEIIVETANWPDYVFGEEYESMSLIEKGQFFKNKHHLPALRNAATYQEGGLPMTEVVTGLTQEVEEAYLHLLDHQEQVNTLNDKVTKMEKEMEELRKLILAKK